MAEQDRRGHGRTVLLAMAAFAMISVMVLFAPILECPCCLIETAVQQGSPSTPAPRSFFLGSGCGRCWKGRISLFTRWLDPTSPFHGAHFTGQ